MTAASEVVSGDSATVHQTPTTITTNTKDDENQLPPIVVDNDIVLNGDAADKTDPADSDDLDFVFNEIGEWNIYQLWKYALIFFPIALSAAYAISFVATGTTLDYRCRIPECDLTGDAAVYDESWLDRAIPSEKNRMKKCLRYNTNITIAARLATSGGVDDERCPAIIFDRNDVIRCDDFVFKTNERRLIQEYDIYCEENEYKLALIGTINSVAHFIAMPFTGYLSDRFGRLTVLVVGMTLDSVMGLFKALSPNYYMFATFEFLEGAAGTCTYMAAFVLSVEWVSTKYRVLSATAVSIFYPMGEVILGLLAMYISSMRILLVVLYGPGLFVAFYWWLMPESVRWLVITGREKRALAILQKGAKANHVQLSAKSLAIVADKCRAATKTVDSESGNTSASTSSPLIDVFKSRVLILRLLNCSLCWIAVVHAFYGMSVSSTKIQGDDNKYLSFILVVFAEIPAAILVYFLSDRWGRRVTLSVGLWIAGIAIVASAYVPIEQTFLTRALFFIGMLSISIAFCMLYIFTAEIWPTSIRNTLMNLCSMIGRFGAMAAPLTPLLAYLLPSLPAYAYGGCAILSGVLVLLLPETLNKKLPDTIEQAIQL